MAAPPEVLFHRYFQQLEPHRAPVRPEDPDPRRYRGRHSLDGLPPQIQSFFRRLQEGFSIALQNEKQVPDHVPHPAFHLDYIEADVQNACAFQYEGYAFIGITLPLIYAIADICFRLSKSAEIITLLDLDLSDDERDALRVVLLQILTSFVVSHEFTHHVHGHVTPERPRAAEYNEIEDSGVNGNIEVQVEEADADGYAVYHVLANLFDGTARSAVNLLKLEEQSAARQDQVLFACVVLAIAAYLFLRPAPPLENPGIYNLTHPPQAARMNLLMYQAIAWCKQNRPDLVTWMTTERFQILMATAAFVLLGDAGATVWQAQNEFLCSSDGKDYFKRLDAGFKATFAQKDNEGVKSGQP
jgi:hypothetical protein